ncbi:MAG TPA: response regulator [Burkholderiales bacterium]|jgi:CheY-like chemotaxis protein|nr:response regulator [Burkholderiales bacterium]
MFRKQKVLAALRPEAIVGVQRALGEYAEILPVYTLEDAVTLLRSRAQVDVILCGIYFGQARMFDLLRVARQEFPEIPFVSCRLGDTEIPQVTVEAMAIAAKSLGAVGFINLPLLRTSESDLEFRSLVLGHARRAP